MSRMIRSLARFALLGLALMPASALAVDEVNVTTGATAAGPGLAVHGYDVVAYFAQGAPVRGSAEFAAVHDGAAYQFSNAANLAAFEKAPEKYAPAFGGFCAYGASVGKKFDGDPYFWEIHAGRLYLNLNAEIQKAFEKDVPGAIAKAETKWRQIEHRAVGDL